MSEAKKVVDEWFRVEVSDREGQIVALESASVAGRDIGRVEGATIYKAIESLNGFIGANFVDLSCQNDRLNPCWNGRPTDVVGKHWGIGDACANCNARAALVMGSPPDERLHLDRNVSMPDAILSRIKRGTFGSAHVIVTYTDDKPNPYWLIERNQMHGEPSARWFAERRTFAQGEKDLWVQDVTRAERFPTQAKAEESIQRRFVDEDGNHDDRYPVLPIATEHIDVGSQS